MYSIQRTESLLTKKPHLEHLYTLKKFPVFMGCVDSPRESDLRADMIWDICRNTGIIQLRELLPLETLYLEQHNDGVGATWQGLYKQFANFIEEESSGSHILEIGGANDAIASHYLNAHPNATWTIVEPHPDYVTNPRINIVQSWFDENFQFQSPVDTIVHSHVLEHTYDPRGFLSHIHRFLKPGGKHIFTFPNMLPMLENKFTNCLNFEHTAFLTEDIVDYLLRAQGFHIVSKKYYGNPHSILYSTIRVDLPSNQPDLPQHYTQYRKVFMDFIEYHRDIVDQLNDQILNTKLPIYLFGAHIFSQYLIEFGLNQERIVAILDNSAQKQGKRLYGTHLLVHSPRILAEQDQAIVILKAGIYNEEIKKDILGNINQRVIFW